MNNQADEETYVVNTELLSKDPILMLMKSMIDKCDIHNCPQCKDIKIRTGIIIKV